MKTNSSWWPPLLILFLVVVTFEGLFRAGILNTNLIPSPSQIVSAVTENPRDFAQALMETARSVLTGFAISALLGLAIAFALSVNPFIKKSFLPFAIFFQTVPIIAVAPLLVIYFGFGAPTVIAAAAIVSIFPVIANTLTGLDEVPSAQRELFRLYRASSLQVLCYLKIPNAYVSIHSGLKIAAGLSVIGAVAGEFVAGGGLGAMIDAARTQQRVDIVYASLILLAVLGWFFVFMLDVVDFLIERWRPFKETKPALEDFYE